MTRRDTARLVLASAVGSLLLGCPGGTGLAGDADAGSEHLEEGIAEAEPDASADASDEDGTQDVLAEIDGEGADGADGADDADGGVVDSGPLPAVCGDLVVGPGEECDDGNRMNGDGCDWLCRVGDGTFDYPPPDETVPPIAPDGPASAVTGVGEMSLDAGGTGAGGLDQLVWGVDRFGFAYSVDLPYYAVRVRFLDKTGATLGEPWSQTTPWGGWGRTFAWDGSDFVLFAGTREDGLFLTRFDSSGTPLVEFRAVEGLAGAPMDAAWSAARFAVSFRDGIPTQLATLDPDGSPLASRPAGSVWPYSFSHLDVTAVDGGFAVTNGEAILVLDEDLALVGWSGVVPCVASDECSAFDPPLGSFDVVGVGDGLVVVWVGQRDLPETEGRDTIWMAGLDLRGAVVWPPRAVLAGIEVSSLRAAVGVAGIGVMYWREMGSGAWQQVEVLNTDRWGNVRSGPVPVFDSPVEPSGSSAIAASDTGFGMVVLTCGDPCTGPQFFYQFRHFAAVP